MRAWSDSYEGFYQSRLNRLGRLSEIFKPQPRTNPSEDASGVRRVENRRPGNATQHNTQPLFFSSPFYPSARGGALEQQPWILLALTVHGGLVGALLSPSWSLGLSAPYAEATLPPASARSPLVSNHTRTFPELERKITPLDQISKPRLGVLYKSNSSVDHSRRSTRRTRTLRHCTSHTLQHIY